MARLHCHFGFPDVKPQELKSLFRNWMKNNSPDMLFLHLYKEITLVSPTQVLALPLVLWGRLSPWPGVEVVQADQPASPNNLLVVTFAKQ